MNTCKTCRHALLLISECGLIAVRGRPLATKPPVRGRCCWVPVQRPEPACGVMAAMGAR